MKIAIPVNEQSMESEVCPSFGRAPYFLFYNSVTKEAYYLDNAAVASQGGAGIRAAQVIADHGVKSLITPRCGENASEVLGKAEVFVYRSIPGTARQNIDAHLNNELPLLSDFHPGFHGHAAK
ncbi:MAG: dinitrogenase iron-molybdenum cofactor biosynthesis protein [Clostridiales bacterium]|nr:dinitrogenase iron-molybdenum cofactor biosynthesis protein [Clostridiales bacterium]